jgi:hypothetical protein
MFLEGTKPSKQALLHDQSMSANKALPLGTNIKARPKHNQNLKVLHSAHDLWVLNVWTKKKFMGN